MDAQLKRTMNRRENYLAAARGETPEWLPIYGDDVCYVDPMIYASSTSQMFVKLEECNGVLPDDFRPKDSYGIQWKIEGIGPMPDPEVPPLVPDIDVWRDYLNIPDTENFDWVAAAPIDSMFIEDDKASQMFIFSPFMVMLNAMGHENAFCALLEDPDESGALLDAVADYTIRVNNEIMPRMRVDNYVLHNDIANPAGLMISPDTYREILKPREKRIFDAIREINPDCVIEYHICGKFDAIVDDIVELGAVMTQPAQPMNDLAGIKAKYGRQLTLNGAWDNVKYLSMQEVTEEEVRQSVRDVIDEQTAGGMPFVFWDGAPDFGGDDETNKRCGWAADEARTYGATVYSKQL